MHFSRRTLTYGSVIFSVMLVAFAVMQLSIFNIWQLVLNENEVGLRRYYALAGDLEAGSYTRGYTPLFYSIEKNRPKSFAVLLEMGADPNRKCRKGTPTQIAAAQKDSSWLELALKHGADVNLVNDRGERFANSTPLAYAAMFSNPSNMELLLKNGASIDAIDGESYTPLMRAAESHKFQNVLFLLEQGADYITAQKPGMTFTMIMKSHSPEFRFSDEANEKPWYDQVKEWLRDRNADPEQLEWNWRG